MLPSKGYFNSLECPFYLSPTKCLRPYCHFKHPKRDAQTKDTNQVEDNVNDRMLELSGSPVASVVDIPVVPPVKHIPIAYIPTKPSAISVNTKKPKSVYIPSKINNSINKTSVGRSVDYDPSSIMDSCEKTYSRYSYEKGHDSGDEIMENHKSLIETNIGKYDDGSKSGYDEETDTYPDDAQFSQEEDDDNHLEQYNQTDIVSISSVSTLFQNENTQESKISTGKYSKCKKKRKYAEVDEEKSYKENKISNNTIEVLLSREKAERSGSSTKDCNTNIFTRKIKIESEDKSNSVTNEDTRNFPCKKIKLEDERSGNIQKKIKIDDILNVNEVKKLEKKVCKYKDKKHLHDSEKHNELDNKEESQVKKKYI